MSFSSSPTDSFGIDAMAAVTAFRGTNNTMDPRVYLTLLTWLCLPLTTTLAVLCTVYERTHHLLIRRAPKSNPNHRTILISGSSPSATSLARYLKSSGHHVIGTSLPPSSARISTSFKNVHRLYDKLQWKRRQTTVVLLGIKIQFEISLPVLLRPKPARSMELAQDILSVVQREKPDIWVPCPSLYLRDDGLAFQQAVETVRAHSPIGILQADVDTAEMLTDESAFTEYVEQLEIGIRASEYHTVTSRDEIHKLLATNHNIARWELEEDMEATVATPTKKLGFEDSAKRRYTWPPQDTMTPPESSKNSPTQAIHLHPTTYGKVILPLSSTNATYQCVAGMAISQDHPWIMREIISGQKITSHLLVINNELRAFVASLPNSTITGIEEAEIIPTTSSLYRPLFSFAEAFTNCLPEDTSSFLSIDFVVSGRVTNVGTCNTIFATSCFVGAQSNGVALLTISAAASANVGNAIADLVSSDDHDAYPEGSETSWRSKAVVLSSSLTRPSPTLRGVYSFLPALLTLVLLPFMQIFTGDGSILAFFEDLLSFCEKPLLWKEELFDFRDPWPWWWEWNVRKPFDLLAEMFG